MVWGGREGTARDSNRQESLGWLVQSPCSMEDEMAKDFAVHTAQ